MIDMITALQRALAVDTFTLLLLIEALYIGGGMLAGGLTLSSAPIAYPYPIQITVLYVMPLLVIGVCLSVMFWMIFSPPPSLFYVGLTICVIHTLAVFSGSLAVAIEPFLGSLPSVFLKIWVIMSLLVTLRVAASLTVRMQSVLSSLVASEKFRGGRKLVLANVTDFGLHTDLTKTKTRLSCCRWTCLGSSVIGA